MFNAFQANSTLAKLEGITRRMLFYICKYFVNF